MITGPEITQLPLTKQYPETTDRKSEFEEEP